MFQLVCASLVGGPLKSEKLILETMDKSITITLGRRILIGFVGGSITVGTADLVFDWMGYNQNK